MESKNIKPCEHCKQLKPLSDFVTGKNRCKECHNRINRELYQRKKASGQSYEGQGMNLDNFKLDRYKCF